MLTMFQQPVLLPPAPQQHKAVKRRRSDSPSDETELPEAPPGVDAEAYAEAVGTSKSKRTPSQREVIKQARIVRNRIAAQTSRDKKRRTFEDLEVTNASLMNRLEAMDKLNAELLAQVKALSHQVASLTASSSSASCSMASLVPLPVSPNLSSHSSSPTLYSHHDTPLFPESSSSHQFSLFHSTSILGQGEPAALSPSLEESVI
ncbi:hypothetical protein BDR26DRAFT_932316 [Obelidium mucronatum]|nr:hypothetical protein BDR26DRAFT_932316 [Obelidium mucronatum]